MKQVLLLLVPGAAPRDHAGIESANFAVAEVQPDLAGGSFWAV